MELGSSRWGQRKVWRGPGAGRQEPWVLGWALHRLPQPGLGHSSSSSSSRDLVGSCLLQGPCPRSRTLVGRGGGGR